MDAVAIHATEDLTILDLAVLDALVATVMVAMVTATVIVSPTVGEAIAVVALDLELYLNSASDVEIDSESHKII